MEKKFTGLKQELIIAKQRGFSNKLKKFIATSLMTGSLIAIGTPGLATQYTLDELTTHQKHVKEITNQYTNIQDTSLKQLHFAFKTKQITQKQYDDVLKALQYIQDEGNTRAEALQEKTYNIKDKNLVFMKTLPPLEGDTKTRIELTLNDISSLNQKQIETLSKKYHINAITLNRYYNIDRGQKEDKLFTYSPKLYIKLLNIIDKKFGDLKNNTNLTDTEKTIIVLKRIENIEYDYEALNLSRADLDNPKMHTSRNLEDPLLNETGICAGYSDLFKNTMSYLGIESKEINGYVHQLINPQAYPGESNHAWNQVKLNGKWYNLDITAIAQNKQILTKDSYHPYLFTSDSEFNQLRSTFVEGEYTPIFGLAEKAEISMPKEQIDQALETAINYERNHNNFKTDKNNAKKAFLSRLSNNGEYAKNTNNYLKTHQKDLPKKESNPQKQLDNDERL